MTHIALRKYLSGLIVVLIVIAFFKLAMADDWYSFLIAFCTGAGILLQWAVTTDEGKKDDKPDA